MMASKQECTLGDFSIANNNLGFQCFILEQSKQHFGFNDHQFTGEFVEQERYRFLTGPPIPMF